MRHLTTREKYLLFLLVAFSINAAPVIAEELTAFRAGPGTQITCTASAPNHISTRGVYGCRSTDGDEPYYTNPSGSSYKLATVPFSGAHPVNVSPSPNPAADNDKCVTYNSTTGIYDLSSCGAGGGMSIGGAVTGATSTAIPYIDGGGNLAQNVISLNWDNPNKQFLAANGAGTQYCGFQSGLVFCTNGASFTAGATDSATVDIRDNATPSANVNLFQVTDSTSAQTFLYSDAYGQLGSFAAFDIRTDLDGTPPTPPPFLAGAGNVGITTTNSQPSNTTYTTQNSGILGGYGTALKTSGNTSKTTGYHFVLQSVTGATTTQNLILRMMGADAGAWATKYTFGGDGTLTMTGGITAGASGDFDWSASSGATKTGTGAVTLNGATTVASGKLFTYRGALNASTGTAPTCTVQAAAGTTATCNGIVGNDSDFLFVLTAGGTGGAQGVWAFINFNGTWAHKPICVAQLGNNPNSSPTALYTFYYDYANSSTTVGKFGLGYGTNFTPPATTLVVHCTDPGV